MSGGADAHWRVVRFVARGPHFRLVHWDFPGGTACPRQHRPPKGSRFLNGAEYQRQLETPLPEAVRLKLGLKEGATYGHAVAFRQVQKSIQGETQAAKEITDRVEGRAVARHAGPDGGPLELDIADRLAQLRAQVRRDI